MGDETKVVTTWVELEEEATRLAEFHAAATDASEAILQAAAARSEVLLRKALTRYGSLKALRTFRVSSTVYSTEQSGDTLSLVN